MKIGVISDIHGNVLALETVLPYLKDCETILCAGDFINLGPWPQETVQLARSLPNLIAVRGNHENRILPQSPCRRKSPEAQAHYAWTRQQLSEDSRAWLDALPGQERRSFAGHSLIMQHYGFREEWAHYCRILENPADGQLLQLFPEEADFTVFGHDHRGTVRRVGNRWFVNPGSLGCPSETGNRIRAAILEPGRENPVTLLDIPYDVSRVVDALRRKHVPDLEHILRAFFPVS